jgi:UDP-N-acetylmuramate dehydrogenase
MDNVQLDSLVATLERLCPDGVKRHEPLERHVTFRIGGPADILVLPRTLDELAAVTGWLYREGRPFVLLGRGSNVLIADRGVRGIVVKTGHGQERIRYVGPHVAAECGVSMPFLSRRASARGLAGLEFAAGIPGSVGGAIAMNAGAHGCAVADVVHEVRLITPSGEQRWQEADFRFGYRESVLQRVPGVVLEAEFRLRPADPQETVTRLEQWLATRSETQPLGPPSSGCIFRNPDDDHAGRLIDAAGAKGLRVGGVVVSDRHANYMLNTGGATAADVLVLIDRVRARVRARFDIDLATEIKLIGEFDAA